MVWGVGGGKNEMFVPLLSTSAPVATSSTGWPASHACPPSLEGALRHQCGSCNTLPFPDHHKLHISGTLDFAEFVLLRLVRLSIAFKTRGGGVHLSSDHKPWQTPHG